jgi:hypothetical protein
VGGARSGGTLTAHGPPAFRPRPAGTFRRCTPTPVTRRLALALCLLAPAAAQAQGLPFDDFEDFLDSLRAVAAIPDAAERTERVGALWTALRAAGRVP